MKKLTVVGVEDGQLIMVSADGERFTVPITEALTDIVRRPSTGAVLREIQAHIRRGLTAQQVADITDEDVAYIQKFEGAVVAERDFIARQALVVPVTTRHGDDTTFGASVRSRLEEISAQEEGWSAWREESGWQLELRFHEGDVEHKARWAFEPRKHLLEPLDDDAKVLSRHEPMPTTLIPRLSAVATAPEPDHFDSEIFEAPDLDETGPLLEPVPYGRSTADEGRMADTTDLLEVLRKRRGEREPAREEDAERPQTSHPATGGIRLVDSEGDHDAAVTPIGHRDPDPDDDDDDDPEPPAGGKKKRNDMPSWEDIVFGARGENDPA
jgi:hypothetical protein